MATADKKMISRFGSFIMIGAMAVLLAACTAPTSNTAKESNTTSASDSAEDVVIVEDYEGDGMDIPLDGTSLDAFNASLARVKKHTSEASYTTLTNAIDYLLVYDLGAQRNREKLAARLNGLTGNEVVAKVGWGNSAPDNEKSKEESAEEVIIDT